MTATPRIYDDATKAKAGEADAVLVSMDNEKSVGPEFYRLGFGDAVAQGLLTDYKVLVLAVDNPMVATTFQAQLADKNGELQLDDVAKIVGCWNGLGQTRPRRARLRHRPRSRCAARLPSPGRSRRRRRSRRMFEGVVDQYVAVPGERRG